MKKLILRNVIASMLVFMVAASAQAEPSVESQSSAVNNALLTELSAVGVLEAAEAIGLDVDTYLLPMMQQVGHQYDRYRWSVGYHVNGEPMISALPPEEEVGWTPWERWYQGEDGQPVHESWVLYPLKNASPEGVAKWYQVDEAGLAPRYAQPVSSLEELIERARLDEAATVLGFDAKKVLLDPLSEEGRKRYLQCRWVVVPHRLAADTPVIYVLPPMHLADKWPWESWYTDGTIPLILHVHYTKATPKTTGIWSEYLNAPERPPEVIGPQWHWYDDTSLIPTMANP